MQKELKRHLTDGRFRDVSPERSQLMRAIKGYGNRATELKFKMSLVRAGISGWVIRPKQIFGSPDFFFAIKKLSIFIDGCYWHGCPKCGHVPNVNTNFWRKKIKLNKKRDKRVNSVLTQSGIRVLRIWEHDLKKRSMADRMIEKLIFNYFTK